MPNRRRDGKKKIKIDDFENESIIKLSKTRLLEILDFDYKLKPEIIVGLKAMGRKQLLEVYLSVIADHEKIQDRVHLPNNVMLPKEQNVGRSKPAQSFRRKTGLKLTKKNKY